MSIGTEPMQRIAGEVLRASIVRRTTAVVEFTYSWKPTEGWCPLMKQVAPMEQGTKFSVWRWLVPALYRHTGRTIYLDADMVCLADIEELWKTMDESECHFAAVRNAIGVFGRKKPEPEHTQTSVMVMDCKRCDWNYDEMANAVSRGVFAARCKSRTGQHAKSDYAALMQAAWLPTNCIEELDPTWNHFGICRPDTRIVHWSHVKSQPYRNPKHPTARVFESELREAVQTGMVSPASVHAEIAKSHLHEHYRGVLS